MIEGTPASRRDAVRTAVKARVEAAISYLDAPLVFTSRAEVADVDGFVSIYFGEGQRERSHSTTDVECELIIRISSSAEPQEVDPRLDAVASRVEKAVSDEPTLGGVVWDCFQSGFAYADSESGVYSSIELIYSIKYND